MKYLLLGIALFVTISGEICAQQQKIDSLLNILPKVEEGNRRIDILNALAFCYAQISVTEAEKFVQEANHLSREAGYKTGLAESFKVRGLICFVRSDYSMAMEYSYQSLKLYEEEADRHGQSKVLNNLAMILIAQKEYGRAYDLSTQSLRLKRQIGDSLGVANSLLSLAEFYRNARDYDKALDFCRAALNGFESLRNDTGIGYANFTMGEIHHSLQQYELAATYYHLAIRHALQVNDQIQLINSNNRLGKLYLESQRYDSAYLYLHRTLRLAHEKGTRNNEMDATNYLADYFTAMGQLDSALHYTRASATIERAIFNSQKQEQLSSLQMLYDFEKKEQELSFQKTIVRRQYVAIIGVSLILILSVIFGYRLYSLNKYNWMAKESLIKLNGEINKINANLESMVQERTEEIKQQNQKLMEYAFFTAHEVRGPLARILGLIELAKIRELQDEDKRQIMIRLEDAATELDEIIRTINRKLESAKR